MTSIAVVAGCAAPADHRSRLDAWAIDESRRVTLVGNTHPVADAAHSLGQVEDEFFLEHMQLVLRRSPEQEAELEARIDALHDKTSPEYQQWLTVEELADRYNPSEADVDTISAWLSSHGLHVDSVPPSRMFIEFSGTAGAVASAFRTRIDYLSSDGARHIGNRSDPQIPEELAKVVVGVHALHDFMPRPLHRARGPIQRDPDTGTWTMVQAAPEFTTTMNGATVYAISPADFATIYNMNPLFSAGITGAGQTIAVLGNSNIKSADVTTFRTAFGLSGYKGTFSQVHPTGTTTCTNPGTNTGEGEAAIDAEWAGATAPDAAIELASCKDTTTMFGGLIALQNLINSTTPPQIISLSFGACEAQLGAANASYVNAYQQAVARGISVFVATGDEGAAACDVGQTAAAQGIAVSGYASTPYNVAVGGTDFMDLYDSLAINQGPPQSNYWASTNSAAHGSALSYVPEMTWNDSCASKLVDTALGFTQGYGSTGACANTTVQSDGFLNVKAGGGGPSTVSNQPSWQTGVVGLPTKSGATSPRYLPDVSLFAGDGVWSHSYVYCMSDANQGGTACTYTTTTASALTAGGTSFAAPAMAGIQALINQKMGAPQGNPNYTYYKLAAAEHGARGSARCNSSGGTPASPILPHPECIFNDVTQGDIAVPCTGPNCFGATTYGALSVSSATYAPAYAAGTGWDFATGLGSVNAYNLVTAWSQ